MLVSVRFYPCPTCLYSIKDALIADIVEKLELANGSTNRLKEDTDELRETMVDEVLTKLSSLMEQRERRELEEALVRLRNDIMNDIFGEGGAMETYVGQRAVAPKSDRGSRVLLLTLTRYILHATVDCLR